MKITNKTNLPKPFVDFATRDYEYKPNRYSVTSLLKPVRQILLQRRHDKDIEQDCSEMVWCIFGQAVHKILEESKNAIELYKEEKLAVTLENGYTISGILDLYDIEKETVYDYKTSSIWKIIHKDFEDWKMQGLAYAWLLKKSGLECKKIVFYALLKDWSKSEQRRKADYPPQAVMPVSFDVTEESIKEIDTYLRNRIEEIRNCEDMPDSDLPLCSSKDRWNTGNKYAVMKQNRKTALKVCDTEIEAIDWREKNGGDFIQVREGIDRKCLDYCSCCEYCDYYKKIKEVNNDAN